MWSLKVANCGTSSVFVCTGKYRLRDWRVCKANRLVRICLRWLLKPLRSHLGICQAAEHVERRADYAGVHRAGLRRTGQRVGCRIWEMVIRNFCITMVGTV